MNRKQLIRSSIFIGVLVFVAIVVVLWLYIRGSVSETHDHSASVAHLNVGTRMARLGHKFDVHEAECNCVKCKQKKKDMSDRLDSNLKDIRNEVMENGQKFNKKMDVLRSIMNFDGETTANADGLQQQVEQPTDQGEQL